MAARTSGVGHWDGAGGGDGGNGGSNCGGKQGRKVKQWWFMSTNRQNSTDQAVKNNLRRSFWVTSSPLPCSFLALPSAAF
jgi:hypothetical protein